MVSDAYRVIHTANDGIDLEVGSVGLQTAAHHGRQFWTWGIDTVLPRQAFATAGEAGDREDAMAQFHAVWEVFASDEKRLAAFLAIKRAGNREDAPP